MAASDIDTTKKSVLTAIENRPTQNGTYWGQRGTFLTETGPLTDLYKKQYTTNKQQYPRDLNSDKKLHSVRFSARPITSEPEPDKAIADYFLTKGQEVLTEGRAQLEAAVQTAKDLYNQKTTLEEVSLNGYDKGVNAINSTLKSAKKISAKFQPTALASDVIDLYMPDGIEFGQQSQYNQIGILEAASSVPYLGKVPSMVLSTLKNDAARVGLNSMGYAFNPQEQVMFEGIEFRTFTMSFTLTPYSSDEAEAIKNIIMTFRKNAAPTIQTGGISGFFYIPPSIFDVQFLYNGSENDKINKLKPCFLTDVTVNYAPNGTWSTFDDGAPVQTTLSLSFKESVLIDSAAISQGY